MEKHSEMMKYSTPFKIDKGIPFPAFWGRATSKYPFGSMEVGDCFTMKKELDGLSTHDLWKIKNLSKTICMKYNTENPNKRFNWAIQDNALRIWRTK